MNAYMVHMLQRAREVHRINDGDTHRDCVVKCPFCVADEDEQWFKFKYEYRKHPGVNDLEQPKRMPAPHCNNCPMLSLFNVDVQALMDDCVGMGAHALKVWEESADDIY